MAQPDKMNSSKNDDDLAVNARKIPHPSIRKNFATAILIYRVTTPEKQAFQRIHP
jgi:hypothetical protein